MPYPTSNPSLRVVGANIVALMQAIPYLQAANGGVCKYAASKDELLDFSIYPTPFCIVVPSGENIQGENRNVGGSVFESMMHWEMYFGSASFSLEGEAFGGTAVGGDPGIDALIDDAITACLGYNVGPAGKPGSKMFPGNPFHVRHDVNTRSVVWRINWRNQFQRIGV